MSLLWTGRSYFLHELYRKIDIPVNDDSEYSKDDEVRRIIDVKEPLHPLRLASLTVVEF